MRVLSSATVDSPNIWIEVWSYLDGRNFCNLLAGGPSAYLGTFPVHDTLSPCRPSSAVTAVFCSIGDKFLRFSLRGQKPDFELVYLEINVDILNPDAVEKTWLAQALLPILSSALGLLSVAALSMDVSDYVDKDVLSYQGMHCEMQGPFEKSTLQFSADMFVACKLAQREIFVGPFQSLSRKLVDFAKCYA